MLRFWEPKTFAIVLGASRRIAADVDRDACQADHVPLFRRSSGGGTVVIGPGVLNATVVFPQSAAPGLASVEGAQSYVLDRMARAIAALAPDVEVRGSGDLVLQGRKFAGSAQRRLRHWFLVHLSILCEFPLDRVIRYLREPERQPDYRARRPHAEFIRNLGYPIPAVQAAIRGAWCDGEHATLLPRGRRCPEAAGEGEQAEPSAPDPHPASSHLLPGGEGSSQDRTSSVPWALVESLIADRFGNREWIERL